MALFPVCALAQMDAVHVRQLLGRSMERMPGFNVIAVVSYRRDDNSEFEQAKVEIAKDGRMHRVVLQPLSKEGREAVDDGKELRVLEPDKKTVSILESPLLEPSDAAFRLHLIDRNYTLQVEAPLQVAGREAVSILAVPRHHDVSPRRLVLDASTGFLLRLDVGTDDGRLSTRMEVKTASFPSFIASSVFELRTLGPTREVRFDKRAVITPSNPPADLGFTPVIPHHLPAGFVVQNAQMNRGRFKSVAVRITDGLVKGTVYESLPADAPREQKLPSATRVETANITFTVVMDAPTEVREHIAGFFAKIASRPGPGSKAVPPPPPDLGTQARTDIVEMSIQHRGVSNPVAPTN